jgi:hypothetical protein
MVRRCLLPALGFLLAIGLLLPALSAAPRASHFIPHHVASGLSGSYQVIATDLNRDGRPDLIGIATGLDEVVWFENPTWTKHVMSSGILRPQHGAVYDTDGDGIPELALVSGFAQVAKDSIGVVSILSHQGNPAQPWQRKEIDRIPTSHRVTWADIDGSGRRVLVNAPFVGPNATPPDFRDQTPLTLYRPGAWKREVVSTTEGLVHGLYAYDWNGEGRDELMTASFSGVHLNELINGSWRRSLLVTGEPSSSWPKSGASDMTMVRPGAERLFVTIEPWHGNNVVAYRKQGTVWSRRIIDDKVGLGHTIAAADLDGDGREELLVADRGDKQGVYVYVARDQQGLQWDKEVLDMGFQPSGCVAVDLNGDKRLDIACAGRAEGGSLKWYENTGGAR